MTFLSGCCNSFGNCYPVIVTLCYFVVVFLECHGVSRVNTVLIIGGKHFLIT